MAMEEGTRFQVLAPVVRGRKGEYVEVFRELAWRASAGLGSMGRSSSSPIRRSSTRSTSTRSTSSLTGWW